MANVQEPDKVCVVRALGSVYDHWESVRVSGRVGEIVRHLDLTVAEVGDIWHGWKSLRLKIGDPVDATLAGQPVIVNGMVTVRQVSYNAHFHGIRIIVSGKSADLPVSSVEPQLSEFQNVTLSQFANAVVNPHGIKFKIKGNPSGVDTPFERVHANIGETKLHFISRYAEMVNLWLTTDENGDLIGLRLEGSAGKPIAELEEGRNIEAAQMVMSIDDGVLYVGASANYHGNDQHWSDDARDNFAIVNIPGFPRYRPLYLIGPPGNQKHMQMLAQHEASNIVATMVDARITVPGWLRADGSLWINHLGEPVSIFSPMLFPQDRMTLFIRGVTHAQSREEGTITVIELCLQSGLGVAGGIVGSESSFPTPAPGPAQAWPSDDQASAMPYPGIIPDWAK